MRRRRLPLSSQSHFLHSLIRKLRERQPQRPISEQAVVDRHLETLSRKIAKERTS